MSEIDYQELFRSPLDDSDMQRSSKLAPVGGGLVAGVAAALLIGGILGGGNEAVSEPVDVSPITETTLPTAVEATNYPAGYVEILPGLAVKPSELIRSEESITLSFTAAAARGGDPLQPIWPVGGTWWLETADGAGAESSRMILGRFSPASFSVEFPAEPFSQQPSRARTVLVERWDHPEISGSVSLPFAGEPFVLDEPITIPATQETSLIVEALRLGRFLGRVDWAIQGPGNPIARVLIEVALLDADENEIGRYGAYPTLLDPADSGVTEIRWQQPFPTSQEGAVSAVVEYSVGIVELVPTNVEIAIDSIPVER